MPFKIMPFNPAKFIFFTIDNMNYCSYKIKRDNLEYIIKGEVNNGEKDTSNK